MRVRHLRTIIHSGDVRQDLSLRLLGPVAEMPALACACAGPAGDSASASAAGSAIRPMARIKRSLDDRGIRIDYSSCTGLGAEEIRNEANAPARSRAAVTARDRGSGAILVGRIMTRLRHNSETIGGDCTRPRWKADRVAKLTATQAAAVSTPSKGLSKPKGMPPRPIVGAECDREVRVKSV